SDTDSSGPISRVNPGSNYLMRCRPYMPRSDCPPARATWGARCRKSARRVLRGGTSTSDLVARPVPTHHQGNHDVRMARGARRGKDQPGWKLMRGYLEVGGMEGGVASARTEGTPQGGPLSPLLSNILLTEDRGTKPRAICGESAPGAAGRTRAKSETSDRRPEPAVAGRGVLLPAHRGQRCAGGARWLDQA